MAAVAPSRVYGTLAADPSQTRHEESFVVDRITRQAAWYFADPVSDEEAMQMLEGSPDGCFLVRACTRGKSHILSYR